MDTIIITGASDGVGAASARELRAQGHRVVIVGRSPAKTEAIARELDAPFHVADFAKLGDVRRLGAELARYGRIDVLANNAGAIMGQRQLTEDGFELTFQVDHLAPFLLTKLLLKSLIASHTRVIQTASRAANMAGAYDLSDLNTERDYSPFRAYCRAKLANILFTRELHRRYHEVGLAAVAFHPGVVRSHFAHDATPLVRLAYHSPLKYLVTISPLAAGHRLSALAQGKPGVDWQPGQVYDKRKPMPVRFQDEDGSFARGLWERSEEMLARYTQ